MVITGVEIKPGIGEGQEVEAVVNDVEFRCPLEDLRNMEALGDLRIESGIFGPTSRDHAAQGGGRLRITRGEQRHLVAPGHQPLGQE